MSRKGDLTGKTFGALNVLNRVGEDKSGNILYLCRCNQCGNEKVFPATTIRKFPVGCGCKEYSHEKMKKMSEKGVEKIFVDNTNITQVFSTKATKKSKTGVRGVHAYRGMYRASVQVAKERIIKDFKTFEEAVMFREEMHKTLIEKYGLKKYRKENKND